MGSCGRQGDGSTYKRKGKAYGILRWLEESTCLWVFFSTLDYLGCLLRGSALLWLAGAYDFLKRVNGLVC